MRGIYINRNKIIICAICIIPFLTVIQYVDLSLASLGNSNAFYFGIDSAEIQGAGFLRYMKDAYLVVFGAVWPFIAVKCDFKNINPRRLLRVVFFIEAGLLISGSIGHLLNPSFLVFVAGIRAFLLLHVCLGIFIIVLSKKSVENLFFMELSIILLGVISVVFAALQWHGTSFPSFIGLRFFSLYANALVFGSVLIGVGIVVAVSFNISTRIKLFMFGALLFGVVLSGTRASIISILLLMTWQIFGKSRPMKRHLLLGWILLFSIIPLLIIFADTVADRGNVLDNADASNGRIGILLRLTSAMVSDGIDTFLFGRGFGFGTNSLFQLPGNLGYKTPFSIIVDNTFGTWMLQFGLFGLIFLIVGGILFFIFLSKRIDVGLRSFLPTLALIILIVTFQQNIFEQYVFLPLLAFSLAILMHQYKVDRSRF